MGCRAEVLARCRVTYQPDTRQRKQVDQPRLCATPHRSPQPYLRELGDGAWLKVLRAPASAPRQRRGGIEGTQATLFSREHVG